MTQQLAPVFGSWVSPFLPWGHSWTPWNPEVWWVLEAQKPQTPQKNDCCIKSYRSNWCVYRESKRHDYFFPQRLNATKFGMFQWFKKTDLLKSHAKKQQKNTTPRHVTKHRNESDTSWPFLSVSAKLGPTPGRSILMFGNMGITCN